MVSKKVKRKKGQFNEEEEWEWEYLSLFLFFFWSHLMLLTENIFFSLTQLGLVFGVDGGIYENGFGFRKRRELDDDAE